MRVTVEETRVTVEDETGKKVVIKDGVATSAARQQWDGTSIAAQLIKASPERRYTLHCAYPANKPDVTRAADGFVDYADATTLEESAWRFIKSPEVGLWHAEGTDKAGSVVESYIYRGPDWTISTRTGNHVIKAGDWLVGIQWSAEKWPLVRDGKVNGVSIQGKASRRRPPPEALKQLRTS